MHRIRRIFLFDENSKKKSSSSCDTRCITSLTEATNSPGTQGSSEKSTDWIKILDKHAVFLQVAFCLILLFLAFLFYTYDRSFRVHQETLLRVHNHNLSTGVPFVYTELSVGHHGTVLKAVVLAKPIDAAIAGQVPIPSPLEQLDVISWIPMNIGDFYFSFTNPSLFMLLTLSLVLLLVLLLRKIFSRLFCN